MGPRSTVAEHNKSSLLNGPSRDSRSFTRFVDNGGGDGVSVSLERFPKLSLVVDSISPDTVVVISFGITIFSGITTLEERMPVRSLLDGQLRGNCR